MRGQRASMRGQRFSLRDQKEGQMGLRARKSCLNTKLGIRASQGVWEPVESVLEQAGGPESKPKGFECRSGDLKVNQNVRKTTLRVGESAMKAPEPAGVHIQTDKWMEEISRRCSK